MILIDSHVHFYECFTPGQFFEFSRANFIAAAAQIGTGGGFQSVLMLAETQGQSWFDKFYNQATVQNKNKAVDLAPWQVVPTSEKRSLIIVAPDRFEIVLIRGRQLKSSENLEALALGNNQDVADGRPLVELIDVIHDSNAAAVIPWGVGKWTGRRGKVVLDLLEEDKPQRFFVGDNGGRPHFWKNPSLFHVAEQSGFRMLCGSDCLPLRLEDQRVASFGSWVTGQLSRETPAADLISKITDRSVDLYPYGKLMGTVSFIKNQLSLKFMRRHSS